jgi:2-phosphoglycerate kinase
MSEIAWRVLLIGGSSGTGKTILGRSLSRELGVPLLLVDDVRLALQAVTSPITHPDLHIFVVEDTTAFDTPETMFAGLIKVARAVEPSLRVIISHHLAVEGAGPIIIEGDGLLPRLGSAAYLAAQKELPDDLAGGLVQAIFLYEADQSALRQNILNRRRGVQDRPTQAQQSQVEGSWRFGQYLRQEAGRHGVRTFKTRPYDTLLTRVIALLR